MSENEKSVERGLSVPHAIVLKDGYRPARVTPARLVKAFGKVLVQEMSTPTQALTDYRRGKGGVDRALDRIRNFSTGIFASALLVTLSFTDIRWLPTICGLFYRELKDAAGRALRTVGRLGVIAGQARLEAGLEACQPSAALPAGPEVTALACVDQPAQKKSLIRRIAGIFNRTGGLDARETPAQKPPAPQGHTPRNG